jgi:hypothetical protein
MLEQWDQSVNPGRDLRGSSEAVACSTPERSLSLARGSIQNGQNFWALTSAPDVHMADRTRIITKKYKLKQNMVIKPRYQYLT